MTAAPTIVAMGGGGFSMESENTLLDDFVLSLAARDRPRLCFLGTPSGDAQGYIAHFQSSFDGRPVEASHLKLFGAPRTDIRDFVLSQDVVYVGGGNTANALAIWRVHGVDAVLREAWEAGVVLAGLSAGMICWFEAGMSDSFGPVRAWRDGLGFLPGSACPHYDGEEERRPTYRAAVRDGFPGGYAADDCAALVFRGTDLVECVASLPDAKCYRVTRSSDGVTEEELPTRYLG